MDLALAFEDSQPFQLTVDQYRALDESGAFETATKVELIEGMIACMSPQASVHTVVTFRIATRLLAILEAGGSAYTAITTPTVSMPPHNALEPDVAVLIMPPIGREYFPAESVALIIEVSRTTLRKDLTIKRDIYARAGVREYWVVDVNNLVVHRFADPRDGVYRAEPPIPLAGELRSLTLPDVAIDGLGIL